MVGSIHYSMSLRQCLHSMYSKRASYFLPSCRLPGHGLGLSFIRGWLLTWSFYLSLCNHFPNCLIKYDNKEEEVEEKELQNSPAISSFSSSSTDLLLSPSYLVFGYQHITPYKTQGSPLCFPDASTWTSLWSKSMWMFSMYTWCQSKPPVRDFSHLLSVPESLSFCFHINDLAGSQGTFLSRKLLPP